MKPRTCETCKRLVPVIVFGILGAILATSAIGVHEAMRKASVQGAQPVTHTFLFHNRVPYKFADWIKHKGGWFYSVGREDWKITDCIIWEITQRGYRTEYATIAGPRIDQINVEGR